MRDKKEISGRFKYKSILTGEYVMPHQWVAEVLVKRKADREEKPLPFKFWTDNKNVWTKEFRKQVQQASKLIKKYSEEAILNFMKNNPWNYSLFSKLSLEKIEKEHYIIVNRPEVKTIEVEDANEYIHRKTSKKSLLGKLNGKKED
jgi:hypothetical protein